MKRAPRDCGPKRSRARAIFAASYLARAHGDVGVASRTAAHRPVRNGTKIASIPSSSRPFQKAKPASSSVIANHAAVPRIEPASSRP